MNGSSRTNVFGYCIGDPVKVACSGERGIVIARAEYESGDDQYLVRLRCGDGCAREVWWSRSAILFDDFGTPNPMDGVELKANTGGGGGVDEAKPAVAEDIVRFDRLLDLAANATPRDDTLEPDDEIPY